MLLFLLLIFFVF